MVARVPQIMQQEAVECGAACLAMVLAYHRKWLPLERVREDCGVSRDGSSAKNMVAAARRYGLDAQGYRLEPEELRNVQMPCILHWNFNHFVVLRGFRGNKAYINDPGLGEQAVSMAEFDRAFTGIVLVFKPTEAFQPEGKAPSVLRFIRQRLHGSGTVFVFILLLSMLTSLLGILSPIFSRVFVDDLLSGNHADWLMPFVYLFSGFIVIQALVDALKANYQCKIAGKFAIIANGSFMWQVLRLPVNFFATRYAGDITMRQNANESIASTVFDRLAPLVLDLAMLVFYLTVMLRYSVLLTAIGLGCAVLNMLLSGYIARKRANIARASMMLEGKLQATTLSGIEMIETIKASGAEDGFFQKWSGYHAGVHAAEVSTARISGYLGGVAALISSLSGVFVLFTGALLIMQRQFSVGMLLAFQGFLTSFMGPVDTLSNLRQDLMQMRVTMERVQDVMNNKPDVYHYATPEQTKTYGKLSGCLELKNVTFGYSPLAKPLLKDLNLTVHTGDRIALVGSSGCGKSTIAKLIAGLYQPWSGEILYDGKRFDEIEHEVFTASIAVVDQDITLFEDTIADNIRMWDSTIEDFEVRLAARDAQIYPMIMSRDGGFRAKLLEGGKNYSGGERQRIEIARAMAGDPTIAILDEATSALDAKTEAEVIKAITDRGITCIIIAHRLSTIRDCTEILVLDHGEVVQRGTHEQLYSVEGRYHDLVSMN